MTHNNFRFTFALYFVIFGLVITLFSSLIGYKLQMINIEEQVDKDAQSIAYLKKINVLKPRIERMDAMVLSLASNELLNEYLNKPNDINKKNVTNIFYAVAAADKLIMQIRFIDKNGKEKIRVDRTNESSLPFIVPDDKLQDKSGRDYFQIVSKITKQEHWHSKLDLNIENGQIEVPYRPTIRTAIPIIKNGSFEGMVIANLLTTQLINNLRISTEFDSYIIDKDGNFILHPDDRYSWNKYTKVQKHLTDDFPKDASSILAGAPKGENFNVFSLNDTLKNDDGAMLILKHKKEHESSIVNSNIKTTFIVAFLSAIISIPLAMYASTTPSNLQKALMLSNIELKRFAEIIDKYVITVSTKTNSIITAVSSAFIKVSGYQREELIEQPMNIIRHPDTPNELFNELWSSIGRGNEWQGEIKNRKKDGSEYWLDQTIIPIKSVDSGETTSYMSVGVDISAKKELEKISSIDKLTGVMTRRKLEETMDAETQKAKNDQKPLSFIIVDIDHFKSVNDTYGHQVGDYVLKATAALLDYNIKKSDLIGRFGGEEFLIICPDTDKKSALILAEKLRKIVFEHDFDIVGQKSISLGIAELCDGEHGENLLKRADDALYSAKNSGRNKAVVAD